MQWFLIFFFLVGSTSVYGHGGRRDSYGGHNDRKAGNYHFHEGPLAGLTYANKEEALSALQAAAETPDVGVPEAQGLHPVLGVVIVPEPPRAGYDRDDYDYPASIEQRIVDRQGGIFSPYSMRCFSSTRETDIEHIVAAAEAHDSGLHDDPDATKRAFARDLGNLTLAAPALNRYQKSDNDPAEWMPQNNRCWYVGRYVAIKQKYGLSMDPEEAAAVLAVYQSCSSFAMVKPGCAP